MLKEDKSLCEVRFILRESATLLYPLRYRTPEKPLNDNEYLQLYKAIDLLESIDCSRWTKEFY